MTRRTELPKRFAAPPPGVSLADETEQDKAVRMLRGLRHHFVDRKKWTLGMTLDGVQIMLIRYRPKPEGPHNPDADLTGVDL